MVSSQPQSPVAAIRILQKPSIGERGTRNKGGGWSITFRKPGIGGRGDCSHPDSRWLQNTIIQKCGIKPENFTGLSVRLPYVAKEEERSGTFGQPSASSKSQNKD